MKGEKERECVCAWKQDGNVANHHKNTRSGKMLIGVARICITAPFKRAPIFSFPIERFSYQRREKPDISAFQSLRKVEENCTYQMVSPLSHMTFRQITQTEAFK